MLQPLVSMRRWQCLWWSWWSSACSRFSFSASLTTSRSRARAGHAYANLPWTVQTCSYTKPHRATHAGERRSKRVLLAPQSRVETQVMKVKLEDTREQRDNYGVLMSPVTVFNH